MDVNPVVGGIAAQKGRSNGPGGALANVEFGDNGLSRRLHPHDRSSRIAADGCCGAAISLSSRWLVRACGLLSGPRGWLLPCN